MNSVFIVGRLCKDPEQVEYENGKKVSNITIAVSRPYKNMDGVYETDFIDCSVWDILSNNIKEYCKKGDLIGIRGRLQSNNYEQNGEKKYKLEFAAEKISFLSSRKIEDKEKIQQER